MAYDERLAARIAKHFAGRKGVTSKKMFGGVGWMLHGNMAVGIVKSDLMARVGPERHAALLKEPHARPMDFTGRPMKGYLFIGAAGVKSDAGLKAWIGRAVEHVETLPAIEKKKTPSAQRKKPGKTGRGVRR